MSKCKPKLKTHYNLHQHIPNNKIYIRHLRKLQNSDEINYNYRSPLFVLTSFTNSLQMKVAFFFTVSTL